MPPLANLAMPLAKEAPFAATSIAAPVPTACASASTAFATPPPPPPPSLLKPPNAPATEAMPPKIPDSPIRVSYVPPPTIIIPPEIPLIPAIAPDSPVTTFPREAPHAGMAALICFPETSIALEAWAEAALICAAASAPLADSP